MPRDDLSIDFVARKALMPPIEHQDAAAVLEEWANRVSNLPAEIAHMQEEIEHKDRELDECQSIIRKHDNAIQKWIKINGSHTVNPKEKDLSRIILENYDKAVILQEEKVTLAQKCQKRVDAHTRYLDVQIKALQDRQEFPVEPDFPSLLRNPPAKTTSSSRADSNIVTMPLAQIPNSSSALHLRQPVPRRSIPTYVQEPVSGGPNSAPATPAASLLAGRQARESSLGAANKRQRLTGGVGVHTGSGLARQSSLGPGTPKANTPTGGARAGSAGPRVGHKTGPKKTAPTGSRQSGLVRKNTKSGLSKIKRAGKKNSPSLTNESELSDAGTGSAEEEDEAATPRGPKDGDGDDDMVDIDEDEGGDDKKYCICQNVSFGDMVACDNDACPYEWFHWSCVGLKSEPVGTWICPVCIKSRK